MKRFILVLLCILTVSFVAFFFIIFFFHQKGTTYTVTITAKGFEPKILHITQYDTVAFDTTLKEDFWPASDLHPTHGIYPEFDPQEPILHTKIWKFQFGKIGKWNFHNHLDPWMRGTIYVEK